MPKPKNDIRVIMYVSYPLKMKIGLFMRKKSIKTYSEFLRMATFFLMNKSDKQMKDNIWLDWTQEKNKIIQIDNKKTKEHSEVIKELKQLFLTGQKILKKIE